MARKVWSLERERVEEHEITRERGREEYVPLISDLLNDGGEVAIDAFLAHALVVEGGEDQHAATPRERGREGGREGGK